LRIETGPVVVAARLSALMAQVRLERIDLATLVVRGAVVGKLACCAMTMGSTLKAARAGAMVKATLAAVARLVYHVEARPAVVVKLACYAMMVG